MRRPQPRLLAAVAADARVAAEAQGRPLPGRGKLRALAEALRLIYASDGFAAHAAYRASARLCSRGIPTVAAVLERLAGVLAGIEIDRDALLRPGVYIVHGEVTVRGSSEIGPGVSLAPFSHIGPLSPGGPAPIVERGARIGTGARILGGVTIGEGARIGANARVECSVPAGATAVGSPARLLPAHPES